MAATRRAPKSAAAQPCRPRRAADFRGAGELARALSPARALAPRPAAAWAPPPVAQAPRPAEESRRLRLLAVVGAPSAAQRASGAAQPRVAWALRPALSALPAPARTHRGR